MTHPRQRDILRKLSEIYEVSQEISPDIRFGQMIDFIGFLGQDMFDKPLVQIDDEDFLKVLGRHQADLENAKQSRALEARGA